MKTQTVEFSRIFFMPWIKGRISLENRMVKTRRVNTILGIIPAGADNQTMPLSNISSVAVNTRYNIKSILIGALLAICGLVCLTSSFLLALLLLLVGVAYIGNGIITVIRFGKGGGNYCLQAACYSKKALLEISEVINNALMDTELGKDSREGAKLTAQATADQTAALLDALKK